MARFEFVIAARQRAAQRRDAAVQDVDHGVGNAVGLVAAIHGVRVAAFLIFHGF